MPKATTKSKKPAAKKPAKARKAKVVGSTVSE
jgi:hypothetical protein